MGKIKIANAPCSWGALEFDLEGEKLGYRQVLEEMSSAGYIGTELGDWGFMPTDPRALRNTLDHYSLDLPGAFVPVALSNIEAHEPGMEKALQVANLMYEAGYKKAFIVLADNNGTVKERTDNAGRITEDLSLSQEQWRIFGQGAEKIAAAVKDKYGMHTVFHHHCAGYVETPAELKALMDNTNPDLVGLCLDMGHYAFGGGDPMQVLMDYPDRVWHIHFKDYDPYIGELSRINNWDYFESVRRGVFCKLDEGEVDFTAIVNRLKEMDYKGWIVVEQDVLPGMGSPLACAKHNLEVINKAGIN